MVPQNLQIATMYPHIYLDIWETCRSTICIHIFYVHFSFFKQEIGNMLHNKYINFKDLINTKLVFLKKESFQTSLSMISRIRRFDVKIIIHTIIT